MNSSSAKIIALVACLILSGCEQNVDWWMTADQQGARYYKQADYARAARSFEDPVWKGLAFYAAQEFASASAIFDTLDTPEANFYLGNSFAQQNNLESAVAAYQKALELMPDFEQAQFNLEWVSGLLALEQQEYDDYGGTGGQLAADDFVIDDRANDATQEMTQVEAMAQGLSDSQIEALWMRRVRTTPGEFLELKFSYQLADREAVEE